ncbi:MAG: GNAT family N-acetyltransferase [Oscillospiraceae bacterium]|nr:GNAT family N-acetyltransferase [Oscillospiraceae bacterium]
MGELRFIQIQKDNPHHCEAFKELMIPYNREIGANMPDGTPISDEFLVKWTQSCIDMQGPHDRHMELAYIGDEPIGFLYGKVDHEGHKGFIKPEYGYIMEFYVRPEYRRKGYGKVMFRRLEHHFYAHGIKRMYLTTGTSGESFWRSLGFVPTGEVSPENKMQIYEKDVSLLNVKPMQSEHIDFVISVLTSEKNKAALHPDNKSISEWREVFTKNLADSDEANFIIDDGITSVAWLKLNGLQSKTSMAWVSMLAVDEKYQRQGIGSFAVRFAEDFVRSKGFNMLGIHTTVDNITAQNCYKKLGYHVHEESECTTGDGVKRRGLSLHRDNLDAVRMNINGVSFHVGEQHDFLFISKIGRVFRIFDAMDSGNICFGVERDGKRYFVKYAGARTQNYNGEITDAITRLKNVVKLYVDLQHTYLIRLIEHYSVGDGYVAVFDWVNGEGLRSYWDYVGQPMWSYPGSPNYRFRKLPIEKRIAVVDKIMGFHQHIIERGYIPVDFYDGSMIYDFDSGDFHICDIDFYRKAPTKNDMGKMWGSTRFMSPEEYELGADLDEKTVVYLMGAAAFELLSNDTDEAYQAWKNGELHRSFNAWSATKALFNVAMKAVSIERSERYQTITELIEAWNAAKTADNI